MRRVDVARSTRQISRERERVAKLEKGGMRDRRGGGIGTEDGSKNFQCLREGSES